MRVSPLFVPAAVLLSTALFSQTYVAAGGYSFPTTSVAPGQIITLFVHGLGTPNASATSLPLPRTLGGITAVVKNPPNSTFPTSLPIVSVISRPDLCQKGNSDYCDTTAVTVQIPFETVVGSNCFPLEPFFPPPCATVVNPLKLAVQGNGGVSPEFPLTINFQQLHVVSGCDFKFDPTCNPDLAGRGAFHGDGKAVTVLSPAHPGEIITLYALGMGPTPGAKTGEAAAAAIPAQVPAWITWETFAVSGALGGGRTLVYEPVPMYLTRALPTYIGMVQGFVGLYQINVKLPDTPPADLACLAFNVETGAGNVNARLVIYDQGGNTQAVDLCVR